MKAKKNFFGHSSKMNKIKSLFVFMIIIAALILSGCDGQQTTTHKNPYIGGTEGLTMEFQEGQPPEEMQEPVRPNPVRQMASRELQRNRRF